MSSQRIPRRALVADSGTGWKKRRGGQYMTWCRGMKGSCKGLASVGPSRLPGWGPRGGVTQWLETLSDVAQNRSQWRSCRNLLLLSSQKAVAPSLTERFLLIVPFRFPHYYYYYITLH
ncbi:unnamed protein product [Schistosoma spindalis]|nr:unnamed protein product [Schistosoma spindale]